MTDVLVAPKYELTKDDLAIIVSVAEETAKSGRPIALLRGPETKDALRKWFPTNDGWDKLQRLGTQRHVGKLPTGEALSIYTRRVERLFVGSKKWPKGVPVGYADIETKRALDSDDYRRTSGVYDLHFSEEERLRFMSEGKKRMTDAEIKEDADRKARLRNDRYEVETFQTPEERAANAIAAALARAIPAMGGATATPAEKK